MGVSYERKVTREPVGGENLRVPVRALDATQRLWAKRLTEQNCQRSCAALTGMILWMLSLSVLCQVLHWAVKPWSAITQRRCCYHDKINTNLLYVEQCFIIWKYEIQIGDVCARRHKLLWLNCNIKASFSVFLPVARTSYRLCLNLQWNSSLCLYNLTY